MQLLLSGRGMFALMFHCYRHSPINSVFLQPGYDTKVLALHEQVSTEVFVVETLLALPACLLRAEIVM